MSPREDDGRGFALLCVGCAVLLALAASCAPGLDGVRQAVATAAQAQVTAGRLLVTWDRQHQVDIAKAGIAAGQPESARAELAAYRARRDVAERALAYAATATEAVAAMIPLVERGLKQPSELDALLVTQAEAWADTAQAFGVLGMALPVVSSPAPVSPTPTPEGVR